MRYPFTEVAPPLNLYLKSAGLHPFARPSFHASISHWANLYLGAVATEPLPCLVHPDSALLFTPWAAHLLVSHFTKAYSYFRSSLQTPRSLPLVAGLSMAPCRPCLT